MPVLLPVMLVSVTPPLVAACTWRLNPFQASTDAPALIGTVVPATVPGAMLGPLSAAFVRLAPSRPKSRDRTTATTSAVTAKPV